MTYTTRMRSLAGVLAVGLLATGLSLAASTGASAADTPAKPAAPSAVTAAVTASGVKVSWTAPATATPAVTHYVVDGGIGTCPVYAPAGATSVVVPTVGAGVEAAYNVQAVNALGYSSAVASAKVKPLVRDGSYVVGRDGGSVLPTNNAVVPAGVTLTNVVDVATSPDGTRYFVLGAKGNVQILGEPGVTARKSSVSRPVAIVSTRTGLGYYVVGSAGAVQAFGDAKAVPSVRGAGNVVGAVLTAKGAGLWLVRSTGSVAATGDATTLRLSSGTTPVVAVAGTPDGKGIWAVRKNGSISSAGTAAAVKAKSAFANAVDAVADNGGKGIRILTAAGKVVTAGSAPTQSVVNFIGASEIFPAEPKQDRASVQILQLSDFHGAIENSGDSAGAALLAGAFAADKAKNPATLVATSGDNIGAAPAISAQFEEKPTIESLNGMGVDVSTFGNHEHDRNLAHLNEMIGLSNFQWVVSNYNSVAPVSTKKAVKTFGIFNRGGVNIGVVGMNTTETKDVVFPGNLGSITINATVDSTQKAINDAKKAGADIVIALVHEGWNANDGVNPTGRLIDVAKQLKGVAAIYGGHSHQQFSAMVGNTMVAMVRNAGVEYTRSNICFNTATKTVAGASVAYVNKAALSSVTPVASVATLVAGYKSQLASKLDVKVGTVSAVFPRGGTPAVERAGETQLGLLITDTMRAKYKTDFALVNGGGIRDTLPAGTYKPTATGLNRPGGSAVAPFDVVLGDVYSVFPFGNAVATTTITGAGLWASLENGVSQFPSGGRFPQISGFKFSFDSSKAAGSRIVSVTKLDGTAVAKDSTTYTIATVDFLVYGGDGYTQFDPKKSVYRELLVDVLVEKLKADLAANKATTVTLDQRIVKVN